MTSETLMKIYQMRSGPQILQKCKSLLYITRICCRRVSLKQVPCWGPKILNGPVNIAVSRLQLGACVLTNIFVWKGRKYNDYAENFGVHRTKFSRPEFVHIVCVKCSNLCW